MSNITLIKSDYVPKDSVLLSWKEQHDDYTVYYDTDFLNNFSDIHGLFGEQEDIIILLPEVNKSDFSRICKIKNSDVAVTVSKKPRFSMKNFDCTFVDNSLNTRQVKDLLNNECHLDNYSMNYIIKHAESTDSRILLARQIALLSDFNYDMGQFLIDPYLTPETTPWRLFDAILSGSSKQVVNEFDTLVFNGVDPVALFFQTVGYMKKVIISLDNDQETIDPNKVSFFKKKARRIHNVPQFVKYISELSDTIFTVPKRSVSTVVKSYFYLISLCCS